MRSLITLALACLSVFGISCWTLHTGNVSGDNGAAPRGVLDFTHQDFGVVGQGEVLVAEFPIRNVGTRRLIVTEPAGSCCGGAADTPNLIIYPGEMKTLRVEIDSSPWSGQMSYKDYVTTNDPTLPRFAITVTAHVR